jgi:hypothetical protein
MVERGRWVLLAYRLPREPSSPRTAVWRTLRRLGAAQLLDGLVALPLDPQSREQLEWLAEQVHENGGEATVWLAQPAAAMDGRAMETDMAAAITAEYQAVTAAAVAARDDTPHTRRRTLGRLRRELRRIRARDYFPPPERAEAEAAVDALAALSEAAGHAHGDSGDGRLHSRQGHPPHHHPAYPAMEHDTEGTAVPGEVPE